MSAKAWITLGIVLNVLGVLVWIYGDKKAKAL